jgi:hypothetical protein
LAPPGPVIGGGVVLGAAGPGCRGWRGAGSPCGCIPSRPPRGFWCLWLCAVGPPPAGGWLVWGALTRLPLVRAWFLGAGVAGIAGLRVGRGGWATLCVRRCSVLRSFSFVSSGFRVGFRRCWAWGWDRVCLRGACGCLASVVGWLDRLLLSIGRSLPWGQVSRRPAPAVRGVSPAAGRAGVACAGFRAAGWRSVAPCAAPLAPASSARARGFQPVAPAFGIEVDSVSGVWIGWLGPFRRSVGVAAGSWMLCVGAGPARGQRRLAPV